MNGWVGIYSWMMQTNEGEKGRKKIQMEKTERTEKQTHEKGMNKSTNNQLISH